MQENVIINFLAIMAGLDRHNEQSGFFSQRVKDARPVQCAKMSEAFTPEQMHFLFYNCGYRTQRKQCYKNSAILVDSAEWMAVHYDPTLPPVRYVEGFAYEDGLLPVEHAFVKVGDKYIDPTFERALHIDVSKVSYVSCFEIDATTMTKYLSELRVYGGLYQYDYIRRHRPDIARKVANRAK